MASLVQKRFKSYVDHSKHAIEFFGLYDFEYEFSIDDSGQEQFRASTSWHNTFNDVIGSARQFTIEVSKDFLLETADDGEIRMAAWHEIMESMFYRLSDMATNTKYVVTEDDVSNELHRIIRILENRLLPLVLE